LELGVLALALLALLALNAFFVLAEFAIVKVRSSRVAELAADGDPRARVLSDIQAHLDQYLGVCQVGITLASIALGMVSKRTLDAIAGNSDHTALRYGVALAVSYALVSGSHIVLGEQVPKFAAIRLADRAALLVAKPLRYARHLFYPALWLLNLVTNGILRVIGVARPTSEDKHSEEELRIILDQSQERGMMSFRRLIYLENVFDFGDLVVRDAMRPRALVRCLEARVDWETNLKLIRASRFTRYPLLDGERDQPCGFIHLKDLVMRSDGKNHDLRAMKRPILSTTETTPLEALLAEMQRKRVHAALVTDRAGQWTGFITLEDVIEELVGTIRDEFEDEEPVRLADAVALDRIHLDVAGDSPLAAVRAAFEHMSASALPLPAAQILQVLAGRERLIGIYLGDGIALPHARLSGLTKPFVMVLRSPTGVPCQGTTERARLLLVLLTPAGQPRVHQRLQSIIATMLNESEYVKERLLTAETPAEVLEVLRTGEQAVLD
jgi:CBS domain containing-hemolysin-like protein